MILEGLITTLNPDGSVNLSPMGPIVDESMRELVLRPYQTSTTYRNLKRTGQGVLHVTDDVELLARAAVGKVDPLPAMLSARAIEGKILANACRWYAFKVRSLDDSQERTTITAEVVDSGRIRDFFGFNRAKHAVVEAAILATRVKFLPPAEIEREFQRLAVPVEKTAGEAERRAFAFLKTYVKTAIADQARLGRRVIHVSAPSRLHFGMFSFGHAQVRQFGGVGVMIDAPRLELEISAAERLETAGESQDRVREFAERAARAADWMAPDIPCRIEVKSAPPAHAGLGSGTQLGMAVAMGLNAYFGGPWRTAEDFARAVGRGRRSAIGLHGAMGGGLLIEAGKLADDEISPLISRVVLPAEWRFVLFWPSKACGLSGEAELQAFQRLPATKLAATEALCREAILELAPAAIQGDFDRFSESLYRFGRTAGECFAAEQGGPYANPEIARLVADLRAAGICGAGQSSWGPMVFALVRNEGEAQSAAERFAISDAQGKPQSLIASGDSRGIQVDQRLVPA